MRLLMKEHLISSFEMKGVQTFARFFTFITRLVKVNIKG